jgi:membrane protease YdiL (CAAX protease family)
VLARLGSIEIILPRTPGQLRHFYGVAVTAGIVEESIWRGFMLWYFGQLMPLWAAVILSSVSFGAAHAYQGVANIPKYTLTGIVFALIYVLTGSLVVPILLHALADALQGRAVYRLLRTRSA